jgi:hypothetical protein
MPIVRTGKLLLISSIIFYVLYDIISTLAAYSYLGTFEYEQSIIIKAFFGMAGIPGFIFIKVFLSMIALYIAYSLIKSKKGFSGFGKGILAGATLSGIFVGTSNLNIIFNGSSFWLFGLDSGKVAALIILGCSLSGFLSTFSKNKDMAIKNA